MVGLYVWATCVAVGFVTEMKNGKEVIAVQQYCVKITAGIHLSNSGQTICFASMVVQLELYSPKVYASTLYTTTLLSRLL
jgi:hypothetical protein